MRSMSRFAPVGMALMVLGLPLAAWAQAPQEWTATGQSGKFPSESAALTAIHAMGGRYALAEEIESVSVSPTGDRITYAYRARPRPQNISEWKYAGQWTIGAPFSSGDEALANALWTA